MGETLNRPTRGAEDGVGRHRAKKEAIELDTPAADAQLEAALAEKQGGPSWTDGKTQLLKRKVDQYRRIARDATEKAYPDSEANKDQEPPVFLELFAGKGKLTKTVSQHAAAYVPQDVFDEKGKFVGGAMDLLIPDNQKRIRTMFRQQCVRWLHCAPP